MAVVFAQNTPKITAVDSLLVMKEVDSLSQVAIDVFYHNDFNLAFEASAAAEKIALEKWGPKSFEYARCCFAHGIVLVRGGDFVRAEPWILESTAIREKVFGKAHVSYLISLKLLALIYHKIGNFEKAESLYLESKAIQEKVLGKEHPEYPTTIHNVAKFYLEAGNYEKAELLFIEAMTAQEKLAGKETHNYGISLSGLGLVYLMSGKLEKAELLLLEAQAIQEKVLGKEHPAYASVLDQLANVYMAMGSFEKVEPLELQALDILEKTTGKDNPDYTLTLDNLSKSYEHRGMYAESDLIKLELFELLQSTLAASVNFLSERELADYASTFQWDNYNLYSFALARPSDRYGKISSLSYDATLFSKGFLLQTLAQLKNLVSSNPKSKEINLRISDSRQQLAAEYAKPVAQQKGIAQLEEKIETAEKAIAQIAESYLENAKQVKWQDVQATLKNDEAALEFIHFNIRFPKDDDLWMYAALLLRPGTEQPVFVPLVTEKALDSVLTLSSANGARKSDYVNKVYGTSALYQMLWQPLEKELAGVNKIYFSPSGLLHRLNLEAIRVSEKESLADRYHIVQLNNTRQLGDNQSSVAYVGNEAVLFGGIQFDMNESAISKANATLATRNADGTRGELDFSQTDSTSRGGDWAYLGWTEKEVDALQPILASSGIKTTLFKGFSGTEEAFKNINDGRVWNPSDVKKPSPRILHLATHGYFFPDPAVNPQPSAVNRNEVSAFKISEHPMIRSGLILAGGNHAWKNGLPLKPDMEDGILTAYEISQMDLSNTELVVLSACETGLGDIKGAEGVYGLQRAFKIAGAKYLIMSLWQVPDFQTQELMAAFYKHWLPSAADLPAGSLQAGAMAGKTEKKPLPEAFRAAQQELRAKYEHPYFWAGFVLLE
ncbi:MAG: CHAT domain-containing protein [Saprospiraceae bacterium]